jgi:hypothetical protein
MRYIKLTQNKKTIVDDLDYKRLNKYKWHAEKLGGKYWYARRRIYYKNGKNKGLYLARMIMKCPKKLIVDHINGDTLDNRRKNLRILTKQQNTWNQKIRINNTSGYRGVSWNRKNRKWKAFVAKDYFGLYGNKWAAALVHNIWAKKRYGKFAKLNKIKYDL